MRKFSLLLFWVLFLGLCFSWAAGAQVQLSREEKLMSMPVSIQVWAQDTTACSRALDQGFEELRRIEQVFSAYRQGSLVNELNQFAARRPVVVSDEFIQVLEWSREISELTQGAFDITVASLEWEYGFGHDDYRVPSSLRWDQIKNRVKYGNVMIDRKDRTVLFKREGVQIDLGGIAKSHALNRVREVLRRAGVRAALVNLGGDVTVVNRKPGGEVWQVGVRHPRKPGRLLTAVPLETGKVLSSGDYQRYFEKDGKRYHHILDVKTGRPAAYSLAATLLLPENPKIDLPSVVLMLLPPDQALALVAAIPNAEALIVDAEQKIWLTPGWKEKLKIEW